MDLKDLKGSNIDLINYIIHKVMLAQYVSATACDYYSPFVRSQAPVTGWVTKKNLNEEVVLRKAR